MAKANETFTLQNVSRQRWAATADANGNFSTELMNLSIQLRIAEALVSSASAMRRSMETRLTAAEKENTTLRNSVARLRKEVRNAQS